MKSTEQCNSIGVEAKMLLCFVLVAFECMMMIMILAERKERERERETKQKSLNNN